MRVNKTLRQLSHSIIFTPYIAAQMPPLTLTTLRSFTGGPGDGWGPFAGVTVGAGIPGRPGGSGANDTVTVYSLTRPSSPGGPRTETLLYSFPPLLYGYQPSALGSGGVLFGTTLAGGTQNNGTVFTLIRRFGGTGGGGPAGARTLFSLTTNSFRGNAWTEVVLYSFTGGSDGTTPNGVVIGGGGILYGTTHGGSISNFGTVFSFTP